LNHEGHEEHEESKNTYVTFPNVFPGVAGEQALRGRHKAITLYEPNRE
jgi:hypothetical protein